MCWLMHRRQISVQIEGPIFLQYFSLQAFYIPLQQVVPISGRALVCSHIAQGR
ncbi:hypothetical protein CPB83DRAFT_856793 [Crepidotus variabilis]|uniref:Uncharacterized protein n=1 Tax=Crepidotus variabilis TaxID=179855 RepID=A0A9P6EDN4_9AGAR|nr:hypothetical protein CPB83DRAFT_856793 [Crepidotus variabilis]